MSLSAFHSLITRGQSLIKLFSGAGKHYSLAARADPALAECHRSGGDLNCARQQNGNEACRMENGRGRGGGKRLKIQSVPGEKGTRLQSQ